MKYDIFVLYHNSNCSFENEIGIQMKELPGDKPKRPLLFALGCDTAAVKSKNEKLVKWYQCQVNFIYW